MQFRLKAEKLKEIVSIANSVGPAGRFRYRKGNLLLQVLDEHKISLLSVSLPREEVTGKFNLKSDLTLELGKLNDFLKAIDRRAMVEVEFNDDSLALNADGLFMNMKLSSEKRLRFRVPQFQYDCMVDMDLAHLKKGLKANAMMNEDVCIDIHPEGLRFSSRKETDSMDVSFHKDELKHHVHEDRITSGTYSLKHLSSALKNANGDRGVLSLKDNAPVVVDFNLKNSSGKARYILAPRTE